jgi:hypothetical protein
MSGQAKHLLGDRNEEIRLDSRIEVVDAVRDLARQARRSLHIYTRDLEPRVYDNREFLDAVTALATSSPHVQIRILLQNPERIVKEGHRLIELSRRLTSYIEIRTPHPDYKEYNQAFLIADETGVLRRPHADRYEGALNYNDTLQARELVKFFTEVWEKSETDPQLRRLHI